MVKSGENYRTIQGKTVREGKIALLKGAMTKSLIAKRY
ncbi:hypothetical protein HMPREF1502_2291 [Klebsiella sp. AS10]|nr:hypothetical protein HMPREF1502_2291 [Klebsiella sp. AS10]